MIKGLCFYIIVQLFKLLSQVCIENENNCKKCDVFNILCHECDLNIYTPNQNGGCEKTKKCETGYNYCDECNEEGNLCKLCSIGYFPDENGGCSYTNNCDISYNGVCLKCKDN